MLESFSNENFTVNKKTENKPIQGSSGDGGGGGGGGAGREN